MSGLAFNGQPSLGDALAIGRLPTRNDALLVAELRGGIDAVARALVAASKAEGWLREDGGSWRVLPDARVSDPLRVALRDRLAQSGRAFGVDALHAAALAVALKDRDARTSALVNAGLVRDRAAAQMRSIAVFVGSDVFLVGGILAIALGYAKGPVLVSAAVLAILVGAATVGAGMFMLLRATRGMPSRTALGNRTLAWIEENTQALAEDVKNGMRRDADSALLAAAAHGA
jgi:hypothetical protein